MGKRRAEIFAESSLESLGRIRQQEITHGDTCALEPGHVITITAGDMNLGAIACMTSGKDLASLYTTHGNVCHSASVRLRERLTRPGRTLDEAPSCALADLGVRSR